MAGLRLTHRDVAAMTLLSLGFAGVVGAVVESKREVAHRIRCSSNLAQVGRAILLYANENRGAYPRTTYRLDAAPVWGTPYAADNDQAGPTPHADPFVGGADARPDALAAKPADNDVTAAIYLLLRTQDLTPAVFVCPSTRFTPLDFGPGRDARHYTNFPGREGIAKHLSYSYQNAYATPDGVRRGFKLNSALTAEFAVMADMNPGGEALLTLSKDAPPSAMRRGNSLNHGGDGQNVLFGDGRVQFVSDPFVGVYRDNIYVANDAGPGREGQPAIAASPADANDSILLPAASDVGQRPESNDLPPTPIADAAAFRKALAGIYDGQIAGRPATLVIDDQNFTLTGGVNIRLKYDVLGTTGEMTIFEFQIDQPGLPPDEQEILVRPDELRFVGPAGNDIWKRRKPATDPASRPSGPGGWFN